jgi:hypothetical protein
LVLSVDVTDFIAAQNIIFQFGWIANKQDHVAIIGNLLNFINFRRHNLSYFWPVKVVNPSVTN